MSAPKVSVVIIAKNEEAKIGDCLESVRWAHEIIVIDSGSTDRTREIVLARTPHFHVETWEGYGAQKNKGIARATGDWILNLDADERATPELSREIADRLADPADLDGFQIPFRHYIGGRQIRHGGYTPDFHLRLFRAGLRFEGTVHEAVRCERVGHLLNPIVHHTYDNIAAFVAKVNRYTSLEAERETLAPGAARFWLLPAKEFVWRYFYRRGFMDGRLGLLLCMLHAVYILLKQAKTLEKLGWLNAHRTR